MFDTFCEYWSCLARVCVSVCLSVKPNLTPGASVHPENTVTYSAGNGGQKICGIFSETASFKSYGIICLPVTSYEVLQGHSTLFCDSRAF